MTALPLPAASGGPGLTVRAAANETAKGLWLLWRRKVTVIVAIVTNAVIYLPLQFVIGGGHVDRALLAQTLPALLAYTAAAGMALAGSAGIAEEVNGGTLEQTCIGPVRPALLVPGRLSALATEGLIAAAVLAAGFGLAFAPHYAISPGLLVPALLTFADALGYALLITALTVTVAGIGAVTHVFNMSIMLFGGMIFPAAVFPHGIEIVARLVPTTLGVQALNGMLRGRPLAAVWSDGTLPLLLVHCAVFLVLGTAVYAAAIRRGLREGRLGARW
ncbi:MAG TPA: ABC transporter permease [Streptosporangiaceae bacterium]|jgi:ABC-2 type transport system permease protein